MASGYVRCSNPVMRFDPSKTCCMTLTTTNAEQNAERLAGLTDPALTHLFLRIGALHDAGAKCGEGWGADGALSSLDLLFTALRAVPTHIRWVDIAYAASHECTHPLDRLMNWNSDRSATEFRVAGVSVHVRLAHFGDALDFRTFDFPTIGDHRLVVSYNVRSIEQLLGAVLRNSVVFMCADLTLRITVVSADVGLHDAATAVLTMCPGIAELDVVWGLDSPTPWDEYAFRNMVSLHGASATLSSLHIDVPANINARHQFRLWRHFPRLKKIFVHADELMLYIPKSVHTVAMFAPDSSDASAAMLAFFRKNVRVCKLVCVGGGWTADAPVLVGVRELMAERCVILSPEALGL